MSDPSQLEPETVAKGGGVLVVLLGMFKFLFTTGVTEVKADVKELKTMLEGLSKEVGSLTTAVAVANKDAISRREFEELRSEVDDVARRIQHIEHMMDQGVVPK